MNEIIKVFNSEEFGRIYKVYDDMLRSIDKILLDEFLKSLNKSQDKNDYDIDKNQVECINALQKLLKNLTIENDKYIDHLSNLFISKEELIDYVSILNRNVQYVYFIKNTSSGLIKIGKTNDLCNRIKQLERSALQCGVPIQNLKYVAILATCSPNGYVEKYLHNYFKQFNVMGEWFSITENRIFDFIDDYNDCKLGEIPYKHGSYKVPCFFIGCDNEIFDDKEKPKIDIKRINENNKNIYIAIKKCLLSMVQSIVVMDELTMYDLKSIHDKIFEMIISNVIKEIYNSLNKEVLEYCRISIKV